MYRILYIFVHVLVKSAPFTALIVSNVLISRLFKVIILHTAEWTVLSRVKNFVFTKRLIHIHVAKSWFFQSSDDVGNAVKIFKREPGNKLVLWFKKRTVYAQSSLKFIRYFLWNTTVSHIFFYFWELNVITRNYQTHSSSS